MSVTINGSSGVTTNSGAVYNGIAAGTAIPYTSATNGGTTIDFTSIPSWVKRITVMLNGVSTSGTNPFLIQLGSGAGPTYANTGYSSYGASFGASTFAGAVNTTGLVVGNALVAASLYGGQIVITNVNSNLWTHSGMVGSGSSVSNGGSLGSGYKDLGAVLTAIRVTTNGSTDTFDAGTINILYE